MDHAGLSALVELNTNALELARTGLMEECRVPVQFSQGYMSNHVTELGALKRITLALVAEGRLAEIEDRPGDAAKSYVDVVHLGTESARGGILIDALVGTAIEALGTSRFQKLGNQFDAKNCRETAAALEALDLQRQPWADVLDQERTWSRRAFPGFRERLAALFMSSSVKLANQKTAEKFKAQQLTTRRLMVDLAARAYQLEKGNRPSSLADLVPDYLKAIPQDPFTGANLVYTP
jgi:hypothetical protein